MIRIAASFQESQRGESVSSAASAYTIDWLLPHNLCCPTTFTSTIANTRNRNSSATNPTATTQPRRHRMSTSDSQHPLPSPQSSYGNPHGSTVPPFYTNPQYPFPLSINTPTTRRQLAISAAMSSSIGNSLQCSRKLSFLYKTFYERRRPLFYVPVERSWNQDAPQAPF